MVNEFRLKVVSFSTQISSLISRVGCVDFCSGLKKYTSQDACIMN